MKILINNKNANRNYEILDKYEAGLELFGTEVKSISHSNGSINEAYIIIERGEAKILNMYVAPFFEGNINNADPYRTRKLLLHKREILKLEQVVKRERLTIIPLKIFWKNHKLKISIALGKGKKLHDKREDLKKRDALRQIKERV